MEIFISGLITLVLLFSSSNACDDVDTQLCIDLGNKYSGLCNDTCLSSICRRSCGLCPAKCFKCHEIDAPKNCSNLVECPSLDHYCFTTQSFDDDFREIYKLGCATQTLCKHYFGNRVVGRGLRIDATCCANDQCNNMTPEEIENAKYHQLHQVTPTGHVDVSLPNLMEACDNVDDSICNQLSKSIPGFCHNDSCFASKLCPRMCGKCFRCYSCNDIDHIDDCNSITTCVPGKLCERFRASPAFGKRQDLNLKGGCCQTDMCNHAIHLTAASTTHKQTTHNPTTHKPACTSYHVGSCPAGWEKYDSSCYHVGEHAMTWSAAKHYCNGKCGKLADFNSNQILLSTITHLHANNVGGQDVYAQRLWSDAIRNHLYWKWSSSGSSIERDIIHHVAFKHDTSGCGAINPTRHGKIDISQVECSISYKPLCELL